MKAAPVFPYAPPRKSYIDFVQLPAADVINTAARGDLALWQPPQEAMLDLGTAAT
jgi:hypothetical protein